ncbi:MAG: DNA mismatch repair protein MutS [Eubacteriaceae bacterium]|nr:DNA mismatch repair protein MutS [Eubacteriaceae bacterium]
MALSPMMQQYMDIKEQHRDCILFFRLGDFYEMFFDDAVTASRELELTLTGKNCGLEERAPMCGVPFHSADSYISKLIEKGIRVAICEQVEDPATTKGLVKREVVQIVTPGTVTSGSMLNERENNYLASVYVTKKAIGFAFCDISTGEMNAAEFSGISAGDTLINELSRIGAKEIIINESAETFLDIKSVEKTMDGYFNILPDKYFGKVSSRNAIYRQFNISTLDAFGLGEKRNAAVALGAQLLYLMDTQKQSMTHMARPDVYEIGNHMALDKSTIRNLELTETLYEKKLQGSLLGILDKCNTAMGSRKMKKWIREPLNNEGEINARLDAVEALVNDPLCRNNIRENLRSVYDFERLSARIACGNANGKDLIALRNSLYVIPEIKLDLSDARSSLLRELGEKMNPLGDVFDTIDGAVSEDPPFTIKEGGVIKEGYSDELDLLKDSIKDAKQWIAALENSEKERTGISNLKVGYNKVFGYYLEITKSNYDKTPDNYIRKQTLANAERYITPELKEKEALVLNAETKINKLEYRIFTDIREYIKKYTAQIQLTSQCISGLDVLASFSEVSDKLGYIKPVINNGDDIVIEKGRHPVIEQTIDNGVFVNNDTYINRSSESLLLITGPNMSGKSTYMRQTALIVLMAQAGCFVPAESAVIGTVDRIFTRIGASDNLTAGQSTFFVEMSELAYILNSATERSLVILDEIGRGTSTYDGLSIAWAVVEHLCREGKQIRTMFASHYHELTSMQQHGLKNLNVDVAEENGEVIFLHKIAEGSASRSYGIHVARLAGVPKDILERAGEKLEQLEESSDEMISGDGHQISFKI